MSAASRLRLWSLLRWTLSVTTLLMTACGGGGSDDAPSTRWTPAIGDTWQWQLSGSVNTGYDARVYDIDLFDTPPSTIQQIQAQGRRVVCYFSAGSSENWRPDFGRFASSDMGRPLDGWAGERWLDTRSGNVRAIMQARLDLAVSKGCDGVEPDNMDAYSNASGLPLDAGTQLDYNRFIAREARARGLAVGLKNDVEQLADLAPHFDFAVNEQCHEYGECAGYAAFTGAGKPVFNAEYNARWVGNANERERLCQASRAAGLRTLVLPMDLDDQFRFSCD